MVAGWIRTTEETRSSAVARSTAKEELVCYRAEAADLHGAQHSGETCALMWLSA